QITDTPVKTRAQISSKTLRTDRWWQQPTVVAVLLTIWVAYATAHVLIGNWYWVPAYHYLKPFYSPCISGECVPGSASLGTWVGSPPPIIPYALVSLPFVLGFRLSCYYYRRAYYRAFWRAPAACAVREPHAKYTGETRFPLVLQNLHRYFFWIAIVFNVILSSAAVPAFRTPSGQWGHRAWAPLILLATAALLGLYSLSCHACRH